MSGSSSENFKISFTINVLSLFNNITSKWTIDCPLYYYYYLLPLMNIRSVFDCNFYSSSSLYWFGETKKNLEKHQSRLELTFLPKSATVPTVPRGCVLSCSTFSHFCDWTAYCVGQCFHGSCKIRDIVRDKAKYSATNTVTKKMHWWACCVVM